MGGAEASTIDPAKVREEIATARKLLTSFTSIKSKITQIKGAVGDGTGWPEKELTKLRDGLSQAFERMDACLARTVERQPR